MTCGGPHDVAAVHLADALVAEAHAEHRAPGRRSGGSRRWTGRRPRGGRDPGEMSTRVGLERVDLVERERVVAVDDRLGAELPQVLHEVVDERVVVVDRPAPGRPRRAVAASAAVPTGRSGSPGDQPDPAGRPTSQRRRIARPWHARSARGAAAAAAGSAGRRRAAKRRSRGDVGECTPSARRHRRAASAPAGGRPATRRRPRRSTKVSPRVGPGAHGSPASGSVWCILIIFVELHASWAPAGRARATGTCSVGLGSSSPASSWPRSGASGSDDGDGPSYTRCDAPHVVHSLWTTVDRSG